MAWHPPTKFFWWFVALHAGVSAVSLLWAFSLSMSRFDTGAPPTTTESAVAVVSTILSSPLFTTLQHWQRANTLFPGLLGWLPLIANSALWACGVWWLTRLGRRLLPRTEDL
jgi:hypothetical protein